MSHPVKLGGIHHAAYRCKDAAETVAWYARVLGMEYTSAFSEDRVPSTGELDPYMHVFLDAGHGNVIAFLEAERLRAALGGTVGPSEYADLVLVLQH